MRIVRDVEELIREAEERMPIDRVIQHFGHAVDGRTKSFKCPFCKSKRRSAGVFELPTGRRLFKCQHVKCPTGTKALDAIGYVVAATGMDRRAAFKEYLRMAGVSLPVRAQSTRSPASPRGREPGSREPREADPPPAAEARPAEESGTSSTGDGRVNGVSAPSGPVASGTGSEGSAGDRVLAEEDAYAGLDGPDAVEVLRAFYDGLGLTEEDERSLLDKRGLDGRAVRRFGLRSSGPQNEPLIRSLLGRFGREAMEAAGLWRRYAGGDKPEAQWLGFGLRGKLPNGEDDWAYGVNPILIPYFDESGQLLHLRPHKGGIKGQGVHLYVPPVEIGARGGYFEAPVAVVTEGEFKAASICGRCRPVGTHRY